MFNVFCCATRPLLQLVCLLLILSSCGVAPEPTGQATVSSGSPSATTTASNATSDFPTPTSVPTPTEVVTETSVAVTDGPVEATRQGQVAFVRDRNLWLFDLASEQETQLTMDGTSNMPTWSPDGQTLVYISEQGENSDIVQMQPDGTGTKPLTKSATMKLFPGYDRDGKLYFVRRQLGDTPTTEIVRLEPDGSETMVHSEPGGLCVPSRLSVYDETQIALSLNCGRGTYVLLINGTTKSSADLMQTYGESGYCAVMAEWTDDGKRLVAITSQECSAAQNSHVAVLDMTSTAPKLEIMYSSNRIGNITLAPDEQSLIFERWNEAAEPTQELWLLDQRGTPAEPRRIVEYGASPAWRPER